MTANQDELFPDIDASTPLYNRFYHLLLHVDKQPAAIVAYCSTGSERHQSGVREPPAGQIIIRGLNHQ